MSNQKILWVDDEIDLLKPLLLFLNTKGYEVEACDNGRDAIDKVLNENFDLMLIDQNMPGIDGLETISILKDEKPNFPIVMITKSDEEDIMNEAIGNQIVDFLIKPVKPNQILLSLKKVLQSRNLVSDKIIKDYRLEFQQINFELSSLTTSEEWIGFYKKMISWELKLAKLEDNEMGEIFESQMKDANNQFGKFIEKNYKNWINTPNAPLLSNEVMKKKVLPKLTDNPTLFLVVDNLRLDQWKTIEPLLYNFYRVVEESCYYSILPTTTQYARNSLFSGLMPAEIKNKFPLLWKDDVEEGGKNLAEKEFYEDFFERNAFEKQVSFHKVKNLKSAQSLLQHFDDYKNHSLITVVYNFVDMISHAKTEMEIIKELAPSRKAYRSLTASWFLNSPLLELIKKAKSRKMNLIITTDHGTINVSNPLEIIGNKETSINLRYKTGKRMQYPSKKVMVINDPKEYKLPQSHIANSYIFAKNYSYFVYPKNYHHYVNLFKNTFQHGGISMEEMIIPWVYLTPK